MTRSNAVSLAEVLEFAKKANKHARAQIEKGSTQFTNNLLTEDRFDALREGIKQIRTVIQQREREGGMELPNVARFEENIAVTSKYSLGNCSELALWALDYMLNHAPHLNTEIYRIAGGDHVFIVINRNREKDIDPFNPLEWGENAVICDPWADKAYCAKEFLKELKNYRYDQKNKKNLIEDFNPDKHILVPQLDTMYLHSARTVENLKKGFAGKCTYLFETVVYYHSLLADEANALQKNHDHDNAAIILRKMQELEKCMEDIKKAIYEVVTREYKEDYRTIRAEIIKQFAILKTHAISTMEFSKEDKLLLLAPDTNPEQYDMLRTQAIFNFAPPSNDPLFAGEDKEPYEKLQTLGLFNIKNKSKTESHLQEITDVINNRLRKL